MHKGNAPHTYTTHPMRLLVHFWNIKLLSLIRALHHFVTLNENADFLRYCRLFSIFRHKSNGSVHVFTKKIPIFPDFIFNGES